MSYSIIVPTNRAAGDLRDLVNEIVTAEPDISGRLILTCQNGSAAHNRNYGLNAAETPVVVMIDDDIRRLPKFFARDLVATLLSDPDHAVVTAKLINPNGRMFMGGRFPNREHGVDLSAVRWAPSACIAIHRTAMRFDETLPCFEDVDYCMQILVAQPSARFVVNNDVKVLHLNRETWRTDTSPSEGDVRFQKKWGRPIP